MPSFHDFFRCWHFGIFWMVQKRFLTSYLNFTLAIWATWCNKICGSKQTSRLLEYMGLEYCMCAYRIRNKSAQGMSPRFTNLFDFRRNIYGDYLASGVHHIMLYTDTPAKKYTVQRQRIHICKDKWFCTGEVENDPQKHLQSWKSNRKNAYLTQIINPDYCAHETKCVKNFQAR